MTNDNVENRTILQRGRTRIAYKNAFSVIKIITLYGICCTKRWINELGG